MPRRAPPHRLDLRTCFWARADRAARDLTRIYDRALAPVGLTIAQFGTLAYLYQSKLQGREPVPRGALADFVGAHRSTFSRQLRALKADGLVCDAANPADQRERAVRITDKGGARLRDALPLWTDVQAQVRETLSIGATRALNGLFDLTSAKLST